MKTAMNSKLWITLAAVPFCYAGLFGTSDDAREARCPRPPEPAVKLLPDPNRVYTGLYDIGDVAVAYGEIKAKSNNRPVGITLAFHDWNSAGIEAKIPVLQTLADPMEGDDVSPLWMINRVSRDGGIMALVWDAVGYIVEHPDYSQGDVTTPVTFDDIFDGVYDHYMRQVAAEIQAIGHPIMLSPAAEFNAIGYFSFGPDGNEPVTLVEPAHRNNQYGDPTIPDGPERVRDLYRYVIDIFDDEGVNNVAWFMYSPTAYMNPAGLEPDELEALAYLHPRFYYPGDEYIDWIGNSAYISTEDPDLNLDFAISSAIEAFEEFTRKPFFIPEFGITAESGQNRAQVIEDVFTRQIPAIPQVRGFAFADSHLFEIAFDIPRLGNHPEEIDAWQEFVSLSDDYTNDLNLRKAHFSVKE